MKHSIRRRIRALACRIANYFYWRDKGMDRKHAWRKADLTF